MPTRRSSDFRRIEAQKEVAGQVHYIFTGEPRYTFRRFSNLDTILGRRVSDNAVSKEYGGRKCGTHSPSASRPGHISDELRESFEWVGYRLCTDNIVLPGLIEVYPHPALVELSGASERVLYKAAKVRLYWPLASRLERRDMLLRQWADIVDSLEIQIAGVSAALSPLEMNASRIVLKAYEDIPDAVICAWVAICSLEGLAIPYGDKDSEIWIPSPGTARTQRLEA